MKIVQIIAAYMLAPYRKSAIARSRKFFHRIKLKRKNLKDALGKKGTNQ